MRSRFSNSGVRQWQIKKGVRDERCCCPVVAVNSHVSRCRAARRASVAPAPSAGSSRRTYSTRASAAAASSRRRSTVRRLWNATGWVLLDGLSIFLFFSLFLLCVCLSHFLVCSLSLSLSLSSSFFFFIFIFRSLRIYLRLSLTRAYSVHLEPAFCLSCSLTNFLVRSGPGRRTKVLLVLCKMNACTMNAISPRNERFSADTVPTSLFSFRHVQIAVRFSWNCTIHVRTWRFVGDYLAIRFHLCYYIRSTYENTILNLFLF